MTTLRCLDDDGISRNFKGDGPLMLISKVSEDEGSKDGDCGLSEDSDDHEYQTASELFDFMAKNQNVNTNDGDKLTQRDIILLYKNIDLGTQLMTSSNEFRNQRTNQHVETVVYNDDPDSDNSDASDLYTNEDLQNVFLINNERLDLFNNQSSVENTVCNKFGDLEIRTSANNEYDKHFLFSDPYIKEQLKSFNLLTTSNQIDGTVLPASLLDYVGCRRLEDNYNFYMDNIIRYVKNTIEHLKRISNGDYLTDKAKEKWREVENVDRALHNNTKVLATSTSIPLHVECKIGGNLSTWDDIVHSAVDIRSLSKILEKKIVVEIPKLLSGSYKLLSKCCSDKIRIGCTKDEEGVEESKESRVDVVVQLKRSETGHIMSNINSIMILQTVPILPKPPLALTYKVKETDLESNNINENGLNIIELNETEIEEYCALKTSSDNPDFEETDSDSNKSGSFIDNDYNEAFQDCQDRNEYNYRSHDNNGEIQASKEQNIFEMCPDNLQMTIRKMSLQSVVPEESLEDVSQQRPSRKKSPKVRIKSPYENHSYILEEKKRRKLIEIRERRERKKLASAENCKINKYKYGKVAVIPQSSNSVTKLSISNKSFYNSIYGQNGNADTKQLKNKNRNTSNPKNDMVVVDLENLESGRQTSTLSPENDSEKFINRSYFLDNTETEMMFVNMKQEEDEEDKDKGTGSASNSSDYRINLNILSQLIAPSDSEVNSEQENLRADETPGQSLQNASVIETNQENSTKELISSEITLNVVPSNTPKDIPANNKDENRGHNKITPSIECRKSIDKIYELMRKLGNSKASGDGIKIDGNNGIDVHIGKGSLSIQASDSGTSLKHHSTSSNPSIFSFDKNNKIESSQYHEKPQSPTNVISKVIISSKSEIPNNETAKLKRERKGVNVTPKVQDNPLKAISQILHEFENVQKNRIKSGREQKPVKRTEKMTSPKEGKAASRQAPNKRQLEQHTESINRYNRPAINIKDRKTKPVNVNPQIDVLQNSYRQKSVDDRYTDKNSKKKISDLVDEVKEARGEAVRGPSKFNSRLNSLAQPKRIYVQAHSEDYQTKYGRNFITDRLQRLAASPPAPVVDRTARLANTRNKCKRSSNEAMPIKIQSGFPIERQLLRQRFQHSINSNSDRKQKLQTGLEPSKKPVNLAETPETKKKTVTFETYGKSQYIPASFSTLPGEFPYVHKARAPIIPNDIDIGSATSSSVSPKESTEIGNKLHHIINSIVETTPPTLEVLNEYSEFNSKTRKDNNTLETLNDYSELYSKIGKDNIKAVDYENASMESDYIPGTTCDGSVLGSSSGNSNDEAKRTNLHIQDRDCMIGDVQPFQSVTAIEKEEHGICHSGTFGIHPKRNELSQKSSIYLLQSNDVGSIMVKASISQNLKTDRLLDVQVIQNKPSLKLDFGNIPMQITTVSYAFPEYCRLGGESASLSNLLDDVSNPNNYICPIEKSSVLCDTSMSDSKSDKETLDQDGQNKNKHAKMLLDEIVQVDTTKLMVLTEEQNHTHEVKPKTANYNSEQIIPENVMEDKDSHETDKWEENDVSCIKCKSGDSIDFSTSLDILVGLLKEIKNIACQPQLTNKEHEQNKELETILNKKIMETSIPSSPFDELSINDLSITSLEKLRCLELDPSVHSSYLSDNQRAVYDKIVPDISQWYDTKNAYHKPIYEDKEVSVDITKQEYVSKLTDVPSIFFPITINHSTNLTNSIVGQFRQSSTQSLLSFTDFYLTKLSDTGATDFDVPINKNRHLDLPNIPHNMNVKSVVACNKVKPKHEKTTKTKSYKQNRIETVQKKINKFCIKNSDFDPVMKMKRDILVTVYSMLVLTVFAALSFPEVLYHV